MLQTHLHVIPRKTGDKLWPSEVTQYNSDHFADVNSFTIQTYDMQSLRRQPIEAYPKIVDLVNSIQGLVCSLSTDSCLSDAWIAAKIRNHK